MRSEIRLAADLSTHSSTYFLNSFLKASYSCDTLDHAAPFEQYSLLFNTTACRPWHFYGAWHGQYTYLLRGYLSLAQHRSVQITGGEGIYSDFICQEISSCSRLTTPHTKLWIGTYKKVFVMILVLNYRFLEEVCVRLYYGFLLVALSRGSGKVGQYSTSWSWSDRMMTFVD